MALDRFVYFKETPCREHVGKLLRGYIGDILHAASLPAGCRAADVRGPGTVTWNADGCRWIVSLTGRPSWAARELEPERPMAKLGLTDDPCMTQSRWFEVYIGDDHIDVITRMADELTNAIAQGFAELAARHWQGRLEAEASALCKHGNPACEQCEAEIEGLLQRLERRNG